MNMRLTGTALQSVYFSLAALPLQVRNNATIVGPITTINTGANPCYLQIHDASPTPGRKPIYAVPMAAGPWSATIIDAAHLNACLGVGALHLGISSTMGIYTAATTTGEVQLMIY